MIVLKEFPNYTIDINGNVFDIEKNKYCHFNKDNYGYILVNLRKNNNWYKRKVHRLLALAYLPNPNNKCDVNHIDGNKSNNNLSNLEWATRSENMKHAWNNIIKDESKSKMINNFIDNSKLVLNTASGIYYKSLKEAAYYNNIKMSTLRGQLLGYYKNKTTLIYV